MALNDMYLQTSSAASAGHGCCFVDDDEGDLPTVMTTGGYLISKSYLAYRPSRVQHARVSKYLSLATLPTY